MDPIGTTAGVVLALAATYRHIKRTPRLFTFGLWITSASQLISAAVTPLDDLLQRDTGFANLSQIITYLMMVVSSYIVALFAYRVAGLSALWAKIVTYTSMVGMTALYFVTDLSRVPRLVMEKIPSPASYAFSLLLSLGILPTHIAAVIGARKGHSYPAIAWPLLVYGAVGALYPAIMIIDRTDLHTLRWSTDATYPVVWTIQLISYAALAVAGVVSASVATKKRTEVQVGQ